jgi:hypothetical protein
MGGMIAATFLAIFFVPLFYRLITDRRMRERRSKDQFYARSSITRPMMAPKHAHQTPGHPPRGVVPDTGIDHD